MSPKARLRNRPPELGSPVRLSVQGLFGEPDVRVIEFRLDDRVTILTGPNGSGKTRVLSILRAMLAVEFQDLATEPFDSAQAEFDSGLTLRIGRRIDGDSAVLEVYVVRSRSGREASCSVRLLRNPAAAITLPQYIRRLDELTWEDTRDGELLDIEDLFERFPRQPGRTLHKTEDYALVEIEPPTGLAEVRDVIGRAPNPTFVRTQRLDVEQTRPSGGPRRPLRRQGRIFDYVAQIQSQVAEALSEYSKVSQRADSQFASRALDKTGGDPPSAATLRLQFDQLAELHHELLQTGLVAESPGVEMGGGTITKSERRFLSVFLRDWEKKLEPLLPVHAKLQMLQQIVGMKLKRKGLRLNSDGRLVVECIDRTAIAVDQLSSGEQHLLALFAMLLFSAQPRSVVLIDEPEISLHATWKHAFLDDIRRVAEAADLHLVLATHSTGIINGQWDLVEQMI